MGSSSAVGLAFRMLGGGGGGEGAAVTRGGEESREGT